MKLYKKYMLLLAGVLICLHMPTVSADSFTNGSLQFKNYNGYYKVELDKTVNDTSGQNEPVHQNDAGDRTIPGKDSVS